MRQRFNFVFWLGMIAFMLVSSLSGWRLFQLHNEIRLRDETSVIEQKLTELYSTLLEADVTFLVLRSSQEESDMKKMLRLVKLARHHVDDLSHLVDAHSAIRKEVVELHDMVIEKLALSERLMLKADLDSDEPFQKVLVIENDLLLTQKVNRKIQTIEAFLITNLNQHRAFVDRYFNVNMLSIGAAAAVAFVLLLAFAGLVWNEIRRRKDLEIDLRQAQEAAIQASDLKSQFLATVSHEIRTPLNGIIGMSEILQQRLQGELAQFAGVIYGSGKTLLRIVSDILDFSKIEANKINVEIQEVRPKQILETAVDLFGARTAEKNLKVYCTYPVEFENVFAADGVRISQVLHNLFGNAVKFTQKGFVGIKGRVVYHSENQYRLRFEIIDSGPGIDSAKANLIFQPFFQVVPDYKNEGTGLGLAISKRLTEIMGGQVGLQNRPEGGSIFWFDLPLREIKKTTHETSPFHKKKVAGIGLSVKDGEVLRSLVTADGGEYVESATGADFSFNNESLPNPLTVDRLRKAVMQPTAEASASEAVMSPHPQSETSILLVEDNPTNQLLAQTQLEHLGYRVHLASNGAECLDAMKNATFSVVLMDCRMPVMDGFEVTKHIRERERQLRLPRIPIIAMTANALDDDRQRCLAAGMDDYVAKPIEIQRLHALIQKWAPDFTVAIDWRVVKDLEKKTSKHTIERLFNSFRDTLTQGVSALTLHAENKNWPAFGGLCHQLRSSSAAVGALVLSRSFERLDNKIEQKIDPTSAEVAEMFQLAHAVLVELK